MSWVIGKKWWDSVKLMQSTTYPPKRLERVEHPPEDFFSKCAGQGYFVDITLLLSMAYLVHAHAWTKSGQADKKAVG